MNRIKQMAVVAVTTAAAVTGASAVSHAETLDCHGYGLHSKTGACLNVGHHRNRRGVLVADYVSFSTPSDSAYEDLPEVAAYIDTVALYRGGRYRHLKWQDVSQVIFKRKDGQVYYRWDLGHGVRLGRHRGSAKIYFKLCLDGQSDQWGKLNGTFN